MLTAALFLLTAQGRTITVSNSDVLARAAAEAKPGTIIKLQPGNYQAGLHLQNIHGEPGRPIRIEGTSKQNPPVFSDGGTGIQLSRISYVELRNIEIRDVRFNGLNIDDGGEVDKPSHHVTLENIRVYRLPEGNHDGIKLSGLDDFQVKDCVISQWGGSGIDMVGCHKGLIVGCRFSDGGHSGIQAKGGTSEITIRKCRFENSGMRSMNLGGSTGLEFFRPSLTKMSKPYYEAKNLVVEGCQFRGSESPIAFVGVDGAIVRFCTFLEPTKWIARILQETREPGFVACRNGEFSDNLVVFRTSNWSAGGFNVGDGTSPDTFRYERNHWFCSDAPDRSQPAIASKEKDAVYGVDPEISVGADGWVKAKSASGAHAFRQ